VRFNLRAARIASDPEIPYVDGGLKASDNRHAFTFRCMTARLAAIADADPAQGLHELETHQPQRGRSAGA
jgi:hypothetical protein